MGRIQGLDLLRGLAIFLVLIRHSWPGTFGGAGIVGVVIFFALSGYLITGLLVKDLQHFGRVRWGRFYFHRAVRLLPALYVLLAVYVLVNMTWNWLGETTDQTVWGVITGVTYTANMPYLTKGAALGHLWTLATEEQFYLLWPLLLGLGFRYRKVRIAAVIAIVVVFAGLIWQLWWRSDNVAAIYTMPFSFSPAIVLGSVARLGKARLQRILPPAGVARAALSTLAIGILFALCLLPEVKQYPVMYVLGGPLIAVCTIVLVLHVEHWRTLPRVFAPMLWLGTISYAAYLWNYPIMRWVLHEYGPRHPWWPWLTILYTLAAATASWFLIEKPLQRWRRRVDARHAERKAPAPVGRHAVAG
ncbi:acyltransferase family protein [Nakamurella alba]|uniref:acyltransferase family protein n=1 Tax=Nakamurella alba TaxID=2665158 RepID=UPI0018A99B1A|nr:acyltransferase [Nakamurella alba]